MKAKRKGSRNEHRTMALLEAAGYRCTRSGASLGVFDVVGIGSADIVLVQVKTRDWPGVAEMEQLRLFPCPPEGTMRAQPHREETPALSVSEVLDLLTPTPTRSRRCW